MNEPISAVMPDADSTAASPQSVDRTEQIEQRIAAALVKMRPGRPGAMALHEEIDLVLAERPAMGESLEAITLVEVKSDQRGRSKVLEEALMQNTQAHLDALSRAGMPDPVLELLQSWVEVTVDARVLQRQLELKRAMDSSHAEMRGPATSPPVPSDPSEPLSAAELGQALGGLSDETVRQRERAGELFSVLRPGRKRGREYPAFQAWPGIAGEPLTKILAALRPGSASVAYGFFTSPTDLLAGLTPIEATLGRLTSARAVDADATDLLAVAQGVRLAAVMKAAEAYAASQAV